LDPFRVLILFPCIPVVFSKYIGIRPPATLSQPFGLHGRTFIANKMLGRLENKKAAEDPLRLFVFQK
jgi:hypothetical protein